MPDKIVVDAMGGDFAPKVVIQGAYLAQAQMGISSLVLVGDEARLKTLIAQLPSPGLKAEILHASQTIQMDESPVIACRKKPNSSIMVGLKYLKDGHASGFVSAGNSGAVMTAGYMILGCIPGISRPAIASLFPVGHGRAIILDVGANVDCCAEHLLQFARLGSAYAQVIFGKKNPSIGLLNIGTEKGKGNRLTISTYKLLEASNLNFYGNIEGFDISNDVVDVIVCDGFVGNVIVKVYEGITNWIRTEMFDESSKSKSKKYVRDRFTSVDEKLNYEKYGGLPLLGLNGVCIIAHGSSSERAIAYAIRAASETVKSNLINRITDAFARQIHV